MKKRYAPWFVTPEGGTLSPAALRAVAELGMARGAGGLDLCNRQRLILTLAGSDEPPLGSFPGLRVERAVRGLAPPPATTLPALGLCRATPWLSRRIFEEAQAALRYRGTLTAGLADPAQDLLPLCGNAVNFIADDRADHWRVAVAEPHGGYALLEGAVHTSRIGEAHSAAASLCGGAFDAARAADVIAPLLTPCGPDAPRLHRLYERRVGFRRPGPGEEGTFGIAAPARGLPCAFVHDLCMRALESGVALAGLTPWRTLLLYPVSEALAAAFVDLMAVHGVAEAPLWIEHWYASPAAKQMGLADTLRTELARRRPGGGGLSVGVTAKGDAAPPTDISVVIDGAHAGGVIGPRNGRGRFAVHVRSRDGAITVMDADIPLRKLADSVLAAADALLRVNAPAKGAAPLAPVTLPKPERTCGGCGMVYDDAVGDPLGGVKAGTPFAGLPREWTCPICGGDKAGFEPAGLQVSGFR